MAEIGEAEALVQRWVELHNDGTAESYGSDRLLSLYSSEVELRFLSDTLPPRDESHGLESLRAAHARSSVFLRNRHVDLYELVTDDDRAVMRYRWQATVASDLPGAPAGTILRYDIAHFITVRDGKIVRSHEYQVRIG